jgi:hypothetical protein
MTARNLSTTSSPILTDTTTRDSSTMTTSTSRQTPSATFVYSTTSTIDRKAATAPTVSPPPTDLLLEDPNPGFNTPALDKRRRHVTNRGNPNISFDTP